MGFPVGDRNAFLDSHITGTLQLAAYTVLPDDEGAGGTEAAGGTYARAIHSTWNAATGGIKTQSGEVDFGVPGPSTVVGVGVWDGSTFKGVSTSFSAVVSAATTSMKIADGAAEFEFLTPA